MSRGSNRSLSCLAALAVLAAAASPRTAVADAPERLAGRWHRVAVEETDLDRFSAIEASLSETSWLVRRLAEPRLRSSTEPPSEHSFAPRAEGELVWIHSRRGPETLVLDGATRKRKTPDGEEIESSARWADGRLETHWQRKNGHGNQVFRILEGGRLLVIDHTVEVTAIPGAGPIQFQTRFERLPDVAAGGEPATEAAQ